MRTYKNPISTAMAEYREDFSYNKEWWTERMGTGRNNEYLWIQFKNGENLVIQADYFATEGNTCLPRFKANDVAYISRYYGDGIETTTAADIIVDTDRIILYKDGTEYYRYEMTGGEFKEMYRQMWDLDDETNLTAWMLDYCRALAMAKMEGEITRQEVEDTLKHDMLATVAIRVTDGNRNNESYGCMLVEDLFDDDELLPGYDFIGCRALNETDDIEIWCQEMGGDLIDEYRKLMDEGRLYVARFWSCDDGDMDILLWKE